MKLIVLRQFRDKDNHEKIYQPGDVLETEDNTRISDLKERGLVTSPDPSQGGETAAEPLPTEKGDASVNEPSSNDGSKDVTAEAAEQPAEKETAAEEQPAEKETAAEPLPAEKPGSKGGKKNK